MQNINFDLKRTKGSIHQKPHKAMGEVARKIIASLVEWLESIAFALAIVVILFTFLLRIVIVDGRSMVPTLQDADRILVSHLFYTPEDGDVIIIMPGDEGYDRPLVKRVIATEGQTLDIIDGYVYVDGVQRVEDFPRIDDSRRGNAYEYPVTVPEGKVFVMGDNRNHSTDSRFLEVGMINEENILGRVFYRIFPFSSIGSIK